MTSYSVRSAVAPPGQPAGAPAAATLSFTDADGFVAATGAPPLQFDLAEVVEAAAKEGELTLVLLSGPTVRLTGLGSTAAELVAKFSEARRDRTAYAFRFGSALGGRWDEGEAAGPDSATPGRAGLRLFGSGLGIVPDGGEPVVVAYGEMRGVALDAAAYQVVVEVADRGAWRIGKLARRTAPFLEELQRARRDFVASYQAQLKDVMPHVGALELQQLSDEWREGVALPAVRLESAARGSTERLLGFLPAGERRSYADGLSSIFASPPRLGFRYTSERAAEGAGRPFEAFALFEKQAAGGLAVAWEALGEMGTATYVFRGAEPDLAARVNDALRATRFAREPLYLSEAELLTTGEHRHHVPLLRRSKELRFLRERLAGRVPHAEPETYRARVEELCSGAREGRR